MTRERATTTSVELDADGAVVVVKRARSATGSDRIASESQILEAARHPGVVDLLATVDAAGSAAVVTQWVGPTTLAAVISPPLVQAAGIMAALTDCIADLHELGVVHGAITAEHIILSPAGQPVVCGFGSAHLLTSGVGPVAKGPEDDVAALGSLLRTLAGEEVDLEPIPERRGWRRRPRWQGYQRRALLTLADQATHDECALRPTARALAAAIHDSVPDARLGPVAAWPEIPLGVLRPPAANDDAFPDGEQDPPISRGAPATDPLVDVRFETDEPTQPFSIGTAWLPRQDIGQRHASRPPLRRTVTTVVGLLGVALLLYGINELRASGSGAARRATSKTPVHAPASPLATRRPTTTQTLRSRATAVTRRTAPTRACRSGSPGGVDLDADGCPDPVRVTGEVVQAAGIRYGVGRTGDRVVVGDWRCDGRATPAVLRPTTGEVFVFSRWAAPDRQVTTKPSTQVPGAASIRAADTDHDGCSELWVRTSDGRAVMVSVGTAR